MKPSVLRYVPQRLARDVGRILRNALITATIAGCTSYFPGRQTYWDGQIREMCEKDGHVQIIEQVTLSRQEADAMPRTEGQIALRVQISKPVNDPVYAQISKTTSLRERDPEVQRKEMVAVRRSDQKVVARWAQYSRVGGDLSTGLAHHTSFLCPDSRQLLAEMQSLFVIKE
jgi:hypothetical protein